jgi:site-specific recombinase XerD
MAKLDELVNQYLDYISIEKNHSALTRRSYKHCLEKFIEYSGARNVSDLNEATIREFRVKLSNSDSGIKKGTQAYYVIVLRNFLKYLIKRGIDVASPEMIELPKIPTRQIQVMEYSDLERLLDAPKGSDLRAARDRAVLEMLFSTGLRISELCSLNRSIPIDRGEFTVRGKGEKLRVVFISDRAKKVLKDYISKRADPEEALFPSLSKGTKPKIIGRITPRAVQRLVSFYSRAAGIPKHVTPHQLRHQFATDLLMNGADLRSVQELLGHANIATTQIYTHVTNKELREIHHSFHARRRKS